jgi:pimeloyl-ACP methyl ester carboxylesterase
MKLERDAAPSFQAGFSVWIKFAMTQPYWQPSEVLQFAKAVEPTVDDLAGYDAPFPTILHRAGPRMLPSMITGIIEPDFGNVEAWARLGNFTRPWLQLAGEQDRNLGSVENQQTFINHIPGARVHPQEHKRYDPAGHFIQDDVGDEMAGHVAAFIRATPNPFTYTAFPSSTVEPTVDAESSTNVEPETPAETDASRSARRGMPYLCSSCVLVVAFVAFFLQP